MSQYITQFDSSLYDCPIHGLKFFSSPFYDDLLQNNLNSMRAMSQQEAPQPAAPATKQIPPRKSEPQTMRIPNFSQPILTGATSEQTKEIYQLKI